jgi:hypothetical protein
MRGEAGGIGLNAMLRPDYEAFAEGTLLTNRVPARPPISNFPTNRPLAERTGALSTAHLSATGASPFYALSSARSVQRSSARLPSEM